MLIRLFHAACAANDRRRARNTLQEFCEDRVKAIRALDEANRKAARALREAARLDTERFREAFFGRRNPVRSGFVEGSAKVFGITEAHCSKPAVRSLAEIGPTRYSVTRQAEAA